MNENINEKILMAGSGGQGVMFMGKALARAAILENKNTTWIPSYGAEMRGGTAHCFVRVSTEPVAAPIFEIPTIAVVLNQPSFDKFALQVEEQGLIIVNSSLATALSKTKARQIAVPLNEWALELGSLQTINILALGVLARYSRVVSAEVLKQSLTMSFAKKKELLALNLRAFQQGVNNG